MGDPVRNRCCWISGGERCRYIGVWSMDTRGGDRFFCRGHSVSEQEPDPIEHGARVFAESRREVPGDFDYSSEACRFRAKTDYNESRPGVEAEFSKKLPKARDSDLIPDSLPF